MPWKTSDIIKKHFPNWIIATIRGLVKFLGSEKLSFKEKPWDHLVDRLDQISKFLIILTILDYIGGCSDRAEVRHNQAWQMIDAASTLPGGNLGRVDALESLINDQVDLDGIQLRNASLNDGQFQGSSMPNADLRNSGLSGTNFGCRYAIPTLHYIDDFYRAHILSISLISRFLPVLCHPTNLEGSDFTGATIDVGKDSGPDFNSANLAYVRLGPNSKTIVTYANTMFHPPGCGAATTNVKTKGPTLPDTEYLQVIACADFTDAYITIAFPSTYTSETNQYDQDLDPKVQNWSIIFYNCVFRHATIYIAGDKFQHVYFWEDPSIPGHKHAFLGATIIGDSFPDALLAKGCVDLTGATIKKSDNSLYIETDFDPTKARLHDTELGGRQLVSNDDKKNVCPTGA